MALQRRGNYWFGASIDDLRAEVARYSNLNGYPAAAFASSVCDCGHRIFQLESDENEGVARRKCALCGASRFIADGADHAEDAELAGHICVCDGEQFELDSAVALYQGSNDVRWYYLGCRCPHCSLVGVFAHWKCEGGEADAFLARL